MNAPSPRPSDDELRRLYLDRRLSAEKIAERWSVSKITALRWLRSAGIERRPALGLANRGESQPTAAELEDLVHGQHLSYRAIGQRYGVASTSVAKWIKNAGIEAPTVWKTRKPGGFPPVPSAAELRARAAGGESLAGIATATGVPITHIRQAFVDNGIPINRKGWGRDLTCADGHHARSVYELRVDDWLSSNSVAHEVEPAYPWDLRYKADFLVGSTYVEIWGVEGNERYQQRREHKVAECKRLGLPLIQIRWQHFSSKSQTWLRRLKPLLEAERADDSLFDVVGEHGLG